VGTFFLGENGNTNTGDAIYLRGFDRSGSVFVDGIRDPGSISRVRGMKKAADPSGSAAFALQC